MNVAETVERIRAAEHIAGRPAGSVTLCAVSKTFPAEAVIEAAALGVTHIGENRVQEAASKRPVVDAAGYDKLTWHLIGHLQTNKARRALELFDVIHTVDSIDLAERLDRIAGELGRQIEILVQVDLGQEETKTGADEPEAVEIVRWLAGSKHLRVTGLMTVPPYFEETGLVRPFFARLRELRDELNAMLSLDRPLTELSMGMSHDFAIAIEEGATIVRVGSAIFGARG